MATSEHHHWQHSPSVLFQDRRPDEAPGTRGHGDWDFSELLQSAIDPRAMPAGGFAPLSGVNGHANHSTSSSFNDTGSSNSNSDYDHSPTVPIHFGSHGHTRTANGDYVEHSYDLFNSTPNSFGPNRNFHSADSSSSTVLSPAARPSEVFYSSSSYSSSTSSTASSRSPPYDVVSPLNSVPEDSALGSASGTISPGALASSGRYPPESTFSDLLVDRQASSSFGSSPAARIPRAHNSDSLHYSYNHDPSSSSSSVPRQFDSYGSSFEFGRKMSMGNEMYLRDINLSSSATA